jgi:hypothetical protein
MGLSLENQNEGRSWRPLREHHRRNGTVRPCGIALCAVAALANEQVQSKGAGQLVLKLKT